LLKGDIEKSFQCIWLACPHKRLFAANNIFSIADIEPSYGDVFKILLGSFVEGYDAAGSDDEIDTDLHPIGLIVLNHNK
jgi:hypothetical protein